MRLSRLVLASAAFVLAVSPALAGDILVTKSGKVLGNPKAGNPPAPGDYKDSLFQITEVTLSSVKYKLRGVPGTQAQPSEGIERIYFDPATSPSEMAAAKDAEAQGDFPAARALWEKVSASNQKWAKDMGAFFAARTFWQEGDVAGAMQALTAFKATYRDSWYLPQATRLNARALLAGGKIAEARAEFESVKELKGVPVSEKNGADFWTSWIDEQLATRNNDQAGLKKAMTAYKTLKGKLASMKDTASVQLGDRCALGVASCQIALNDWKGAEKDLERMISSAESPVTKAGAHTLMGNSILAKNATSGDRALYREALWHFLRVVCLYGTAEGAEDYRAEAMYKAGSMFSELRPSGDTDADKETRKRWASYARREWSECIRSFPNSPWAAKSDADMREKR